MIPHYYQLPLDFKKLISKKEEAEDDEKKKEKRHAGKNRDLPTCDLKQSIAQNIYLIITSRYKENRYDESYGCELWDLDFELVSNENMWLEKIRKSVYNSVIKHEPRLYDVSVDIDITLDEQVTTLKSTRTVKKRLTFFVNGHIAQTGEPFPFNTNIYLSPLSLD